MMAAFLRERWGAEKREVVETLLRLPDRGGAGLLDVTPRKEMCIPHPREVMKCASALILLTKGPVFNWPT
jgi:hypothetical protein